MVKHALATVAHAINLPMAVLVQPLLSKDGRACRSTSKGTRGAKVILANNTIIRTI